MTPTVSVVADIGCQLGEGTHWDAGRQLLWFVDIIGREVLWFEPTTGALGRRLLPEPVGWVLAAEDSSRVLLGLQSGVASCDVLDAESSLEWLDRRFPGESDLRLNDAKVDCLGRIWYGSVSVTDESKPLGSLARFEPANGNLEVIETGYMVPNGPAFNEDCTVMLHSDSARRVVYRYSLDAESGEVLDRSVWRRFAPTDGYPDGMTFDEDGSVWIAHWGAGKICRYAVDGRRQETVTIPARHPTNVCFGGRERDRLFVTSARMGSAREREPHAGALFEVLGSGVRGIPGTPLRVV